MSKSLQEQFPDIRRDKYNNPWRIILSAGPDWFIATPAGNTDDPAALFLVHLPQN